MACGKRGSSPSAPARSRRTWSPACENPLCNRVQRLRDLLAIRLAWGAILLECRDDSSAHHAFAALQVEWERAPALLRQAEDVLRVDEIWQLAFEVGYQRGLARRLRAVSPRPTAPVGASGFEVQAVFCIDVRSTLLQENFYAITTLHRHRMERLEQLLAQGPALAVERLARPAVKGSSKARRRRKTEALP